jgi:tetratricopeptide (TPR) repeat protein
METEEKFFRPASSNEIIRAVIAALKSDDQELAGRTVRRYQLGESVNKDAEQRIFEALADDLVRVGFVPPIPGAMEQGFQVHDLLATVIRWHVEAWDDLSGGQRSFAMPVRAEELMTLAYLRLAVVDLAFRTAAVCWLTGSSLPDEQPPLWAGSGARSLYLRALMSKIGSRKLTMKGRNGLAEQVDVSTQAVDGWMYQGVRPSNAHIDAISGVLAELLGDRSAVTLAADLRRHYTLCSLAELLAEHVGWAQVEDLASALIRIASRLASRLQAYRPSVDQEMTECQITVAAEGVTAPQPPPWITWLWEKEEDRAWQGDIFTATRKDWGRWLYDLATEITVADEATRFAKRLGAKVEDPDQLPRMVVEWHRENSGVTPSSPPPWAVDPEDSRSGAMAYHDQSLDQAQTGDLEEAIRLMRKAIEAKPGSGWFHVKLAEMLADIGQVDSGIVECWIADGFSPEWEQPRVMIGIILNNASRFEEAKEHLEATADHLGESTINLALNLGIAYFGCEDLEKALREFEAVIEEKPDQGQALELAARCYFLKGDHVEGWRKAKAAKKLGYELTFDDASAGVFRKNDNS